MPLPQAPTLSEVRAAALNRVGMRGVPTGEVVAVTNEKAREAQAELFWQAEWVRLRISATIPLTDGVDTYDIPDDMDLGGLQVAWVQNSDGLRSRLYLDSTIEIYNTYRNSSGKPNYLWIMNSGLTLTPKPDSSWTTLYLEYNRSASGLVNDQDRVSVDGEALIQRMAYKMKEHYGIGGDPTPARIDHERYLMLLRGKQRPPQMFPIASEAMDGPVYWARNGGPATYTANWNPWP